MTESTPWFERARARLGLTDHRYLSVSALAAVGFALACAGSRQNSEHPEDAVIVVAASFNGASGASRAVQSECGLQRSLPQAVAQESLGLAVVGSKNEAIDRRSLRLEIQRVEGMGGGIYTGQKSLTVRGDLFEKGKRLASVSVRRVAQGGVHDDKGFSGTCSLLDSVVHHVAGDLAKWLNDPKDGLTLGDPP